jgi:hypothetical protein
VTESQQQSRVLPLKDVYELLENNGFQTESALLREAIPGRELSKRRAKRGMAIDLLRSKGLWDQFLSQHWANGLTNDGKSRIARYETAYKEWKNEEPAELGDAIGDDDREDREDGSFAYETDLRDYLVRNLNLLEPGLQPWTDADAHTATEYPADDRGRRIDILAKDRQGVPVVIELKVSKGHERVVGQSLYYRGSLKQRLSAPRVRVIIVAREISDELRIATRDLADIDLFEYRLSMTLNKV